VGILVEAYQDGNQAEDHQDHQEEVWSPWEDQVGVWSQVEDHPVAYQEEAWSQEEPEVQNRVVLNDCEGVVF
jgi:hypothetical protein